MSRDDAPLEAALLAAADGDVARVRDLLAAAAPSTDDELLRWWLALTAAGVHDVAATLAPRLAAGPHADEVAALTAADTGPLVADDPTDPLLDLALPPAAHATDDDVVAAFLRWFGGRRDLYARQWYDERRRRSGYHPVEAPLTAAVVRDHLAGRTTLGQYLLFPDATVSFAVIDLDLAASALAELRAGHGDDVSPLAHPGLRAFATRLTEVGEAAGIPLFAEDSGGKGLHLWVFFAPRRPARAARAVLAQLLHAAGAQPPDVGVEVFPKQDQLGARGLSSLVKLPLGTHRATLRPCPLLDRRLEPLDDARAALAALRPAPDELVDDLLGRRLVLLPTPALPSPPPEAPPTAPARARSLGEQLRAIEPGRPAQDAADRVLRGCAILHDLVERAYRDRRLAPAEARAITYTLGLIGPGPNVADEVFAAAQAARRELDRARRGVPAPTGCARLRQLGGPAPCARCAMDRRASPYATPALLAIGASSAPEPPAPPFAAWQLGEAVVEDPVSELNRRLERIEHRLDELRREREP